MSGQPYLDTSALAKWYLNESGSEAFEDYVRSRPGAWISTLGRVELRCLLARRRRAGDFDRDHEEAVFATFEEDLRRGALRCCPLDDAHFSGALHLIASLPDHPLRTLDALHLAVATGLAVEEVATADRVMSAAARDLGLSVASFGA